jgi:LysM repeat protein
MRNFVIIIVAGFFLLLSGTSVLANEVVYTVKSGDSLWQIANKHGITVSYLKQVNNLNSNLIFPGNKLILSQKAVQEATPTPTPSYTNSSIYTIQSGDSLWKIANRFGVSIDWLKQNNNLISDKICVGDKLLVGSHNGDSVSRSALAVNGNNIVIKAAEYLGTPYAYGGQSPGGFDCSGFVKYVFSQFGYNLQRTAAGQFQAGKTVARTELLPGDLVFFRCNNGGIDHVGIYAGNNQFIHSSSPRSGGVIYSSMNEGYYVRSYVGAKRIVR